MTITIDNVTTYIVNANEEKALILLLPFLTEDRAIELYKAYKYCTYREAVDWYRKHNKPS